jgi:hypothetical protein
MVNSTFHGRTLASIRNLAVPAGCVGGLINIEALLQDWQHIVKCAFYIAGNDDTYWQ